MFGGGRASEPMHPWVIAVTAREAGLMLGVSVVGPGRGDVRVPAAPDPEPDGTARARTVVSALSLLALIAGLGGLMFAVAPLRVVGILGYLLFGVGAAPWTLCRRMGLGLRLALSLGTSVSVAVIVSTVMLQFDIWFPTAAAATVFTLTAPWHIAGLIAAVRDLPDRGTGAAPARPTAQLATTLSVTGAVLCAVAALTHRHLDPGLWGFLRQVGPWWYVGAGLIVLSLALARSAGEFALAVGVLMVMLVLSGTPALVYDGPRSQSAAKHVELVDQIRALHHLRSTVAVYNGWPGYFSAMAWLADVTGLRDPIGIATAWPVLIGPARLIALRFFTGQLIADGTRAWLAVLFVVLTDAVGQDYFAPQSLGFVVALIILGLALARLPDAQKAVAMTVAGGTLTMTHQLSPYAAGGALCVLVAFRRIRPWWLPGTVLGPAAVWALLHSSDLAGFVYLGDLGNAENFQPPATEVTPGLSRLPVVTAASAALAAGVLLLAILALVTLVRHRRDRSIWAIALCPGVGLVIITVNPYGNEGIFRATLFAIPWFAVLAAMAFRPVSEKSFSLPVLAVALTLTGTFVVAAGGLDASNVMRPEDRAAFRRFQATDPGSEQPSFLLLLGPGDLPSSPPTQSRQHVAVKRSGLDDAGFRLDLAPADAVERELTGRFLSYTGPDIPADHLYALWSPVSSYYGWEYGIHTRAQFAGVRDAFGASPNWATIYSVDGTVLFEYTGAR
jgi:hypothetical protein